MKRILFTLMVLAAVLSVAGAGNLAYFSDTETSTGSTFTAGVWNSPPSVTVTCPNGGEVWHIYQTVSITWTADDPDGVSPTLPLTIHIWFDANGGRGGYPYHIAMLQQTAPGSCEYYWQIPYDAYLISDECRIQITATDEAGASASDESDTDFSVPVP